MDQKLLIDVVRLKDEGETFEGEVDIVDIDEELVKPFGGVRYRLEAKAFGTELLVKGRLEQDFDLVCSRCGKDFDTTIKVEDFIASMEIDAKQEYVDLTDEAREAVLLALPNYPVCGEACEGVPEAGEPSGQSRGQLACALDAAFGGSRQAAAAGNGGNRI